MRVALLGLRRTGRRRGGRRWRCYGGKRLSLPGDVTTAECKQTAVQPIPVVVTDRSGVPLTGVRRRYVKHKSRFLIPVSFQSCNSFQSNVSSVPKFYIINASSLVKPHAFEQLKVDVKACEPDVVIVTESHFSSRHNSNLFSISGFVLFRKDRVKRKGGGVCVYIKECLDPVILAETYSLEFSEIMFLRIKHSGVYYLFCACYHPPKPKYNSTKFINMLDNNIESLLDVNDSR